MGSWSNHWGWVIKGDGGIPVPCFSFSLPGYEVMTCTATTFCHYVLPETQTYRGNQSWTEISTTMREIISLWTQGFTFAKEALYHLSHVSSPFALVVLEVGSHFFVQASLDYNSPILYFPPSLGWQACSTMPSFFHWDQSPELFAEAGLDHYLPNLNLPSN
jgi:hypothetical protein